MIYIMYAFFITAPDNAITIITPVKWAAVMFCGGDKFSGDANKNRVR